MIEVKLEFTGRRRSCLFCEGESAKNAVNAVVYRDGVDTYCAICSSCLNRDNASLREIIAATAGTYRTHADALDAIAADLPPLPSVAELQAATVADDHLETLRVSECGGPVQ